MILKFPISIGLFVFVFSACDPKPEPEPEPIVPIISLSEVDETDPDLKPGGPPVHQPLEEEDDPQINTGTTKPIQTETDNEVAASTAGGDETPRSASGAPAFIPGDSVGDMFDTSPPPMEFKFTAKQLVDSGLLGEGGSDIYHTYMTAIINKVHNLLIQSESEEEIAPLLFLCDGDIPLCRKEGVSLDRLNTKKMMDIIYIAGGHEPTNIYLIGQGEALLVLQGPEITQESLQGEMEKVEKNGSVIKKVLINLPQSWVNRELFFYLASQIKEKQMDLHIVGQCSSLCANHLIPAARHSVTEYYGHIGYLGNMSSVAEDVKEAYPPRLKQLVNQFRQDYFSQSVIDGLVRLFGEHVTNPMSVSLYNQLPIGKALNQAGRTLAKKPAFSFWGLSPEDQGYVLAQLKPEMGKAVINFFFNISEPVRISVEYHNYNQEMAKAEMDHYEEFQILPESSVGYSYSDFVTLTGRLIRNLHYKAAFPSSRRSYYGDPEEDKPYVTVFPSVELLNALGIPIQGENPTKALRALFSESSENSFLFLSLKDMENCDFFASDASFTTKTLQDCLSEDGSL